MNTKKIVGIGLALVLLAAFAGAQSSPRADDAAYVQAVRAWLAELEPRLTKEGTTNARHIATRLNTLRGQILYQPDPDPDPDAPPPPDPIDCELSDRELVQATPWSTCSLDGTQTRTEIFARTVRVHPEHGGLLCGALSEEHVETQDCGPTPEPQPTPDPIPPPPPPPDSEPEPEPEPDPDPDPDPEPEPEPTPVDPPARVTQVQTSAVTETSLRLSWTHAGGADEFEIYRGRGGTSFKVSSLIASVDGAERAYDDAGLQPGTAYRYWIVAVNAAGRAEQSNTREVKTPGTSTGEPDPGDLGPSPDPGEPVPPPPPEPDPTPGKYAYWDLLIAHPNLLTAHHYRTQTNIDLISSRAEGEAKIPIVYDPSHDAAKFEIDCSGVLPHSGSAKTPQKRLPIEASGATSLLITWEMKIAESMRYKTDTEIRDNSDGTTSTVKHLGQHKSHRLDDPSAAAWVGMKQDYAKGTNRGLGIANFFFTTTTRNLGEGTMKGGSETIARIGPDGKAIMPPEFYVQPDVWTRVWLLIEGAVSTQNAPVQLSVWLADEHRDPMQMYDRINLIAPDHARGIGIFRYEFDTSQSAALNGPGQQYQRNFGVLRDVTRAEVLALLAKP